MKFILIILSILNLTTEGRIAGGRPVQLGEVPYFALIQMIEGSTGMNFQCGSSLIRHNFVITLARCLASTYTEFYVSLGKVNKNAAPIWDTRIVDRTALSIHPNYSSIFHLNDIGLIELRDASPDILNSPFIDVVNLPLLSDENFNLIGMRGQVSGFGSTGGSSMSNLLNLIELTVTDNQHCNDFFPSFVSSGNLCTEPTFGSGVCNGDDGGPLVSELSEHRKVLIGIVGLTTEGCTLGVPGLFTRVSHHLIWIQSVIGGEISTTTTLTTTEIISTTSESLTTTTGGTLTTTETLTTSISTTESSISTTETLKSTTSTTETLPTLMTTTTETSTTSIATTETLTSSISTTEGLTTISSTTPTQLTTLSTTTTESTTSVPLSAPKGLKFNFLILFSSVLILNLTK